MNHADPITTRPLPANLNVERYVLAEWCSGRLTIQVPPEDFSIEPHRRIAAALVRMDAAGMPANRITLIEELERRGELESVGGYSYLSGLEDGMPEIAGIDSYVRIVADKATLRRAIAAHHAAIEECYAAMDPTPEILARAEHSIAALTAETRTTSLHTPMDIVNANGGISAVLNPEKRRGTATGIEGLDRMLVGRGFQLGQLVIVGARPGMGKTALGAQIAVNVALDGHGVALYSLEMSGLEILQRMAASRARVDGLRFSQGWAKPAEIKALSEAFADLCDENACPLWVDDTAGGTLPSIRGSLRRLMAKHPIKLVVIDYLQLLSTAGGSERRRYEQVTEISRGLKILAKELNITALVLAQLNRESEKGGKPHPSQLRDSGAIEQDADVILLPTRRDGQDEAADVMDVDLWIAKQRNGPSGISVPLRFMKRYATFEEPGMESARVA